MTAARFRLGLVQMRCAADPAENLATATARIREAAARGARLVCLPELFRTRYFCQREDAAAFDLAEPVPGPTTDALARLARELGIAVVGSVFERRAAGQTVQRAHAIANGVYVAAVNRVGHEGPADGGLEFWGASFACDPFGVVLAEASWSAEEILVVECDLARQEDVRRSWPFLRDRRIDAYGGITKRPLDGGAKRRSPPRP